jgi:hypothetical protein
LESKIDGCRPGPGALPNPTLLPVAAPSSRASIVQDLAPGRAGRTGCGSAERDAVSVAGEAPRLCCLSLLDCVGEGRC